MLPQIRLHSRDSNSSNALHTAILAEEPQRKIDIVNGAVDENPAGELRIRNEEPARIELVACLRAEDGRRADIAVGHACEGIAVGGVEASRETTDDFLGRVGFYRGAVGVDDGLGLCWVGMVSPEYIDGVLGVEAGVGLAR
jgi:hypothetical protein